MSRIVKTISDSDVHLYAIPSWAYTPFDGVHLPSGSVKLNPAQASFVGTVVIVEGLNFVITYLLDTGEWVATKINNLRKFCLMNREPVKDRIEIVTVRLEETLGDFSFRNDVSIDSVRLLNNVNYDASHVLTEEKLRVHRSNVIQPLELSANFNFLVNGMSVYFENLSLNALTYYWDFGDNSLVTPENYKESPVHIYSSFNTSPILASSMVANVPYRIVFTGSTVWTSFGATSNDVGTIFIASGAGTGTGTVVQIGFVVTLTTNNVVDTQIKRKIVLL
jgi:hypothetical protein